MSKRSRSDRPTGESAPARHESKGPARGYSWAPFEKGNMKRLSHGARSPRVYGPVAEELAAGIVERRPDLAGYPEAVAAWADCEARAILLREWLAEHGTFDEDGEPRDGQLRWLSSFEKRADEARRRLGLDPKADADLARARAESVHAQVDLAGIASAGRAAL